MKESASFSRFFSVLWHRLPELMALNLLSILCCAAVVTIPGVMTALAKVDWLCFDEQDAKPLIPAFFTALRWELLRALPLGVPFVLLPLGLLLACLWYISAQRAAWWMLTPALFALLLACLLFMAGGYAFSMQATVSIPTGKLIRNAVLLVLLHPGRSIGIFLLSGGVLILGLMLLPHTLPLLVLILPVLSGLIASFGTLPVIELEIQKEEPL